MAARAYPTHVEVILLIGLQGSGKTTFYRRHFASSHEHLSKDLMRNARNKEARQQARLDEALRQGRSVVLDNTQPDRASRAASIAIARAHRAHVVAFFFETDVELALERNRAREGRARVPDVAVHVAAAKLEPPSYEEGFDAIYDVTPDGSVKERRPRPAARGRRPRSASTGR